MYLILNTAIYLLYVFVNHCIHTAVGMELWWEQIRLATLATVSMLGLQSFSREPDYRQYYCYTGQSI